MQSLKAAIKLPRHVQIEWEDGFLAKFPYVWLHDNSNKRPSLIHLDLNARPETMNCSREELNMLWSPFIPSRYSSQFLRTNAITELERQNLHHRVLEKTPGNAHLFSPSQPPKPTNQHRQTQLGRSLSAGPVHSIFKASNLFVDNRQTMGKFLWFDRSMEPGTVWPQFQTIPSLCIVTNIGLGEADLSIVNSIFGLTLMRERFPDEFDYLSRCELEYKDGPCISRHPVCGLDKNGDVLTGVFNNTVRSSTITVDSVETLFECLQKLGRICAEVTESVSIRPDQCLVLNNTFGGMIGAPAQRNRKLLFQCIQ